MIVLAVGKPIEYGLVVVGTSFHQMRSLHVAFPFVLPRFFLPELSINT